MVTDPPRDRLPGAIALDEYLTARATTLDAFGTTIGVTGVTVHRWVRGKARPSFDNARAIEAATNGAIAAAAFFPELAAA